MVGRNPPPPPVASPEVARAVDRWAATIFGAPRRLSPLITQVERSDEVVHRVFAEVVRRDLREERGSSGERRTSRPRIELSRIDPFAFTPDDLRDATVHDVPCIACQASGLAACQACQGSGLVACHGCDGAARIRNPKTNRLNNCKVCKATGQVACGSCSSSGTAACRTCGGSGHQRAWLSIVETRHPRVSIAPQGPLADAHRQLREPRMLQKEDTPTFVTRTDVRVPGPLAPENLAAGAYALAAQQIATVDPRLERVACQQYVLLAVPRVDVTYAMCGATGRLMLTGSDLWAATTPEAKRPIHRRLIVWPLLTLIVLFFINTPATATVAGRSAYFAHANSIVAPLWLAALVLAALWLGGLLRAWRPGPRVIGMRSFEVALVPVWLATLVAMVIVGLAVRPSLDEVKEALAADDVHRARVVIDALHEAKHDTSAILDAEDAVLLAEANAATGPERLAKLDMVASHGREQATTAASAARVDRIAEIQHLVDTQHPDEAIAAIDRSFTDTWQKDPALVDQRARAHDLYIDRCSDDPCRLMAARAALAIQATPARTLGVEQIRAKLVDALASQVSTEPVNATRLHTLTGVIATADLTLAQVRGDEDLTVRATAVKAAAVQERASVRLLGADRTVLDALFSIRPTNAAISSTSLDGTDAYFTFDAQGACQGIYAVGPATRRTLHSPTWPADRLLSQALGRPATIQKPADATTTVSTWTESGTKIVARWRDGKLVELRIGDAKP